MAIVYKTTDTKTDRIYIGVDSINNPAYFGSGTEIKQIMLEGRISDLRKEILFIFDTVEEAFAKESEIVTEDFIKQDNVMNIALGGVWGSYSIGKITAKDKDGNIHTIFKDDERVTNGELVGIQKNKVSVIDKDGNRLSVSINDKRYLSGELKHNLKGRRWLFNSNTEHKVLVFPEDFELYLNKGYIFGGGKIRKVSSQSGMKLIHKGSKNTRVKLEDLQEYLNNGWSLGWVNIKERKDSVNKKGPKAL